MKAKIAIALTVNMLFQPLNATACEIGMPVPDITDELVSFNTCRELESHVDKLLSQTTSRNFRGWGRYFKKGRAGNAMAEAENLSAPSAVQDMAMAKEARSDSFGGAAPEKVTGTNNQVEKVDEADFVKFNGKHIYQLYNGALKILKAWPANELNQIASLAIQGQPREMLINDSNAVILAANGQNLKAIVVDITQPAQPRVLTEFEIPGQYRTARLIGDTLRIVNQDYNSFMTMWNTTAVANVNGWLQDEVVAHKLNIKPTTQMLNGTSRTLDVMKDCKNVYVPKNVAPQVLTRIVSIDLKAKKYDESMAFIQPETVYASENAIYLAQSGYTQNRGASVQRTAIHKFALTQGQSARYQASGIVNGQLVNQFAMDEHKGNLRVATNGTERKGAGFWGGSSQWQQVSRVQVLAVQGQKLQSIGQTPDLAKGERLYSARFDGDKGYVVTFRQVDPLFTIDLKNPHRPRVVGELKVPGFSTYIHMLDRTHLLTIGQDADVKTGRTRGLKLSVFDVSDFARPREVKNLIFKSDVSSESSYEHKAFSFYGQKGVLAIPAQQGSSYGPSRSSLLLFQVTTSIIKAAGEVSMTGLQSARRSFFADGFVYAIGEKGVRTAAIDKPQNSLATVLFDQSVAEVGW